MDEQAAGGMALGLVVLMMATFLGVALANRAGLAPMWLGIVVAIVAAVTAVAASEAHRR